MLANLTRGTTVSEANGTIPSPFLLTFCSHTAHNRTTFAFSLDTGYNGGMNNVARITCYGLVTTMALGILGSHRSAHDCGAVIDYVGIPCVVPHPPHLAPPQYLFPGPAGQYAQVQSATSGTVSTTWILTDTAQVQWPTDF